MALGASDALGAARNDAGAGVLEMWTEEAAKHGPGPGPGPGVETGEEEFRETVRRSGGVTVGETDGMQGREMREEGKGGRARERRVSRERSESARSAESKAKG